MTRDFAVVVVDCRVYEQLKVPHEQLTLIPPQFETPLPPLQPAVSRTHSLFCRSVHKTFDNIKVVSGRPPPVG